MKSCAAALSCPVGEASLDRECESGNFSSFNKSYSAVANLQEADGFVLPESSAILKYLAQKHQVADHWYPGKLLNSASGRSLIQPVPLRFWAAQG